MQPGQNGPDVPARRFHAYYTGLPKTGSTSMAGIFQNYRCAHEFMFRDTVETTARYQRGELSREALAAFLRRREAAGRLEMDAATFNFAYLDLLIEMFPEARFVFAIRDCYSWLDSLLDMSLRFGAAIPQWMLYFPWPKECAGVEGIADPRAIYCAALESPEHLSRILPRFVGGFLDRWGRSNRRTLSLLPRDKSLFIRTNELSGSLPRLARFMQISPDTLSHQGKWLNRAPLCHGLLSKMDPGLIESYCERYCRDLMDTYFPGYRFRDFLEEKG